MTDPIPVQLATLRDYYALYLTRLEASDMDPLFRRAAMKEIQRGIDELDRQIAKEEASAAEPLECSIDAAKRYQDCHEQ